LFHKKKKEILLSGAGGCRRPKPGRAAIPSPGTKNDDFGVEFSQSTLKKNIGPELTRLSGKTAKSARILFGCGKTPN